LRVLLITDHVSQSAYLHKALRECAHSVHVMASLTDGFHVASEENFDVVVVLCADPVHAQALLRLLPQLGLLSPVPGAVVVLFKASAAERTQLLRAGADACFVQPYAFAELHERMQAILRLRSRVQRMPSSASRAAAEEGAAGAGASASASASAGEGAQGRPMGAAVTVLPALRLDDDTHRLAEGSREVTLSVGEYLFVKCLMRAIGCPVSREQLIAYAWPDKDEVESATVGLVASRLRRKMRDAPFNAYIETVPRFGYRLCLG